MTRRSALLLFGAAALPAATRGDFLDVLMKLAAALSAGDTVEFFRYIDKDFAGRETLSGYIAAIAAAADVTSSVEIVKNSSDTAEADWYLELKSKMPAGPLERRRQLLQVDLNGARKVTRLAPLEFFAPLRIEP